MNLADLGTLTVTTRSQYLRVYNWLQREYQGSFDRMEPMQAFMNSHPKCRGLHARILQSLVNRYIQPRPKGPPITIIKPPKTLAVGCKHKIAPESLWTVYLPPKIRNNILEHCGGRWLDWLRQYTVTTLGCACFSLGENARD